MSDYTTTDRELGWDDQIENDGGPYEVLPEGDYSFQVEKFERARHPGSDKIPPCNKAVLTLSVTDGTHSGTVMVNLFLYTKFEWKLCQFFTAIGQRKHGEAIRMNWNNVPGATGVCRVKIRKWTGNDGKQRDGNEVDTFYAPEDAPVVGNGGFTEAPKDTELPTGWGAGF